MPALATLILVVAVAAQSGAPVDDAGGVLGADAKDTTLAGTGPEAAEQPTGSVLGPAGPRMNETLRSAAARISPPLLIGSQFKGAQIADPEIPLYRRTHSAQYSLSTVGNDCKWQATHGSASGVNISACVAAKKYADSVGQQFRGHNLCWGNNNPQWLLRLGQESPPQLRGVLQQHIKTVMQGLVAATGSAPLAWDVVNEACASHVAANGSYFKSVAPWSALPDYVDVAFRAARAADPSGATKLFYNDFGAEQAGDAKSETVYAMVKSMVQRQVPIDGVGLQMHVSVGARGDSGWRPPSEAKVSANIERLGALGLQVHVTEMDVKCPDPCDASARQAQAHVYSSMLRACLAHPGVCTSFESWGFTDAVTWLTGTRCPTQSCHPLPFDEHYLPKPAAQAMLQVLQQHAARQAAAAAAKAEGGGGSSPSAEAIAGGESR
jgi:endo-1,4-beta-xylanase